jgi:hypothetical protein
MAQNTLKSFRLLPNGPKSSQNSTEFLTFFLQKAPKKLPNFRKIYSATVAALKTPNKPPKKLSSSGVIPIWGQLYSKQSIHPTFHITK